VVGALPRLKVPAPQAKSVAARQTPPSAAALTGFALKESVGADGDAAPLMMKNLPANCRRRRQKISGQLFGLMLDAVPGDLFKKIIRPCRRE